MCSFLVSQQSSTISLFILNCIILAIVSRVDFHHHVWIWVLSMIFPYQLPGRLFGSSSGIGWKLGFSVWLGIHRLPVCNSLPTPDNLEQEESNLTRSLPLEFTRDMSFSLRPTKSVQDCNLGNRSDFFASMLKFYRICHTKLTLTI